MARKLQNWLTSYLEYVENTESPKTFHKWVGLSVISSVLRKKVEVQFGRLSLSPNIYVILVGPPGARKSEAVKYGVQLLADIPDINASSDCTTPEAFIEDMESSKVIETKPDGTPFAHCSMSIISRELGVFLGNKEVNEKILRFLTDVYDTPPGEWKYRVKHGKSNVITGVYVNMLGAITPQAIADALPVGAVGTGLVSRILFVYMPRKERRITFPATNKETERLKEVLITDLCEISKMQGTYHFSLDASHFWDNWYQNYDEQDPKRLCPSPHFEYWYDRKADHILKISQLVAASKRDGFILKQEDIAEAIALIEEIEPRMDSALSSAGKSIVASETELICHIIQKEKVITESALMMRVLKDIDPAKFDHVINAIVRSGQVKRKYTQGNLAPQYIWVD